MKKLLAPIAALLISDALLLAGHGMQLTLLPLRAQFEGFSAFHIALTGSSYFLGFVLGCLVAPLIVRRVGHIRSFAVLSAVFACLILGFHLSHQVAVWIVLRLLVGACISGLYMIIESWLNERATSENRGTLLSTYNLINLSMMVLGQQLINLAAIEAATLFSIAAILVCLAIVPVSLTLSLQPAPVKQVKIDLRRVWSLSRAAVGGATTAGLITGSFWTLGPVFAQSLASTTQQLTLFMSTAVLGGAVFQLPLGRLSDHYDRRLVMLYSTLVLALVSIAMIFAHRLPFSLVLGLVFLWGGGAMTLYALCLAHANDRAPPTDFVLVSSGMLLIMGVSSALGGPMASAVIMLVGSSGLFYFSALCALGLVLGLISSRRTHVLPVHDETEPFRIVPDTITPSAFEMDPRADEHADHSPKPANL